MLAILIHVAVGGAPGEEPRLEAAAIRGLPAELHFADRGEGVAGLIATGGVGWAGAGMRQGSELERRPNPEHERRRNLSRTTLSQKAKRQRELHRFRGRGGPGATQRALPRRTMPAGRNLAEIQGCWTTCAPIRVHMSASQSQIADRVLLEI